MNRNLELIDTSAEEDTVTNEKGEVNMLLRLAGGDWMWQRKDRLWEEEGEVLS